MAGLYVLKNLVGLLLDILELIFFARAVLSWLLDTDNDIIINLYEFTYNLTEPLIMPVRNFLGRFAWANQTPIDFAFIITFVIVSILNMIF